MRGSSPHLDLITPTSSCTSFVALGASAARIHERRAGAQPLFLLLKVARSLRRSTTGPGILADNMGSFGCNSCARRASLRSAAGAQERLARQREQLRRQWQALQQIRRPKQERWPPNLHEDLPDGAVGWLRNLGFGGGRSESKIVAKVPFWASFLAPPGSDG